MHDILPTMSDAPVQHGPGLLRLLIVAPLNTAAGCASLWIMRNVGAVGDRLGWPLWIVALLGGLVVVGPLLLGTAALNDRVGNRRRDAWGLTEAGEGHPVAEALRRCRLGRPP